MLTVPSCQPKPQQEQQGQEQRQEQRQEQQGRTEPWSVEQASQWYQRWGWLRGCNFIPSTAINQLEMWQEETFDPVTIDRELGWAAAMGMNCMRVYLHHAAWEIDRDGFKQRVKQYMEIADKHGIATIFVFFDDCWTPAYSAGKQPEPQPGVHNSGWVRDPGDRYYKDDSHAILPVLETYVTDILTTFRDDPRIVLWDLYNEPGGSNPYGMLGDRSLPLLQLIFTWSRKVNPLQPLSSGIWNLDLSNITQYQIENSDVITYHQYGAQETHRTMMEMLKQHGRPMICTEYMARHFNSTFQEIMPMLKAETIGAINWGLVSGKTNTIFKWEEPLPELSEPPLWFHDIFRQDGTPYLQDEVDFIRSLCEP
jgi:hypothetical protein